MTYLAVTGIINFITSICVGLIVILKNSKNSTNRSFFYLNLSVAFFSLNYFLWQIARDPVVSIRYFKFLIAGFIFINVTYLHFTFALLGKLKEKKNELRIYYFINVFFALLNLKGLFFVRYIEKFNLGHWPVPTNFFNIYLVFWFYQCLYGFVCLLKGIRFYDGLKKEQIKYFAIAAIVGFIGGASNWPVWYGINIPPYLNILISVYVLLVAYAIIRYHLMDIRLAITTAGLLLFVYALVLGFPFWIGYKYQLWQHSTWIGILLATAGPFIYFSLQKTAEKSLLKKERDAQDLLKEASFGMTTIRDLQEIMNSTVDLVIKILKFNKAAVFLFEEEAGRYVLRAPSRQRDKEVIVESENFLIDYLKNKKTHLIYDELKMAYTKDTDLNSKKILSTMESLSAQVVMPIIMEENLLGFLLLGGRDSNGIFTKNLLSTLSILCNQAALAIQNCNYWEAEKKRIEEEGVRERIASLDAMAASFAHEVDNPISVVLGQIGVIKDMFTFGKIQATREHIEKINSSFEFIIESVNRVSGMVKSILQYSRKGAGVLCPVSFCDVLEGYFLLMQPQLKRDRVDFIHEVENDLPLILGDKIQIEEILINLTQNAIHAVKNNHNFNKTRFIKLKIFKKDEKTVRMECEDNGYGVPQKLLSDIFLASVTTKGSSEGTGLGLFRIRKIVDLHKGKVWAESDGRNKGSIFIVELPVYIGGSGKRKPSYPKKKIF